MVFTTLRGPHQRRDSFSPKVKLSRATCIKSASQNLESSPSDTESRAGLCEDSGDTCTIGLSSAIIFFTVCTLIMRSRCTSVTITDTEVDGRINVDIFPVGFRPVNAVAGETLRPFGVGKLLRTF